MILQARMSWSTGALERTLVSVFRARIPFNAHYIVTPPTRAHVDARRFAVCARLQLQKEVRRELEKDVEEREV